MKDWPEFQQKSVLDYHHPKDYNTTFFSKILLQYAFLQNQISFDWEQLDYTEKDRPYFKNLDIDFNISHSGKYVALVIGEGRYGIDIEQHRPVKIDLFNRQFAANEWQIIRTAQNEHVQFFKFWAIKEAAIKADGRGVEVLSKTQIISEKEVVVENKKWHYQQFEHLEGYSFAVCGRFAYYFNVESMQTIDSDVLLEKM
ncbi:MAG TPA: 4'-phosphopantetheinyl transferase superfamily protein [Chitinophagales bacterium]|nr:4'-phosphopantetheinyl transferase superfamily protein [Chitinophagales bacterium]